MNNNTLLLKVKQRLNKLDSQDYDNLPCWAIVEAFNKAQIEWCRRNLHGGNALQEGDEQSISRIDDMQRLIVETPKLNFVDKGIYFQSLTTQWPADYLRFNGIDLTVLNTCCTKPKRMTVYLGIDSDVDIYLDDPNIRPSYAWGETFVIVNGDKLNIYHNNEFTINECVLLYYRQPRKIEIASCKDPYTGLVPTVDITSELNDDLVEVIIDDACEILAGDIGSWDQKSRLEGDAEKNN